MNGNQFLDDPGDIPLGRFEINFECFGQASGDFGHGQALTG
jgi:hypothetical protein